MRFPFRDKIESVAPFNAIADPTASIVHEPVAYAPLLVGTLALPNGKESYYLDSDVSYLLGQREIDKSMLPLFEALGYNSVHELSDSFSHLTDDDIIGCIKSRYIQTSSEIQEWSKYIMNQLEVLDADAAKAAASSKADSAVNADSTIVESLETD